MSTIALRPYQEQAIDRVYRLAGEGQRTRILVVAPTGAGKGTVAAWIIADLLDRAAGSVFVAHRRELINQLYCRLLDFGLPEHEVGVIMAGDPRRRPGALVQVASIDTLRNRPKPKAELLIIDEAHRAGRSYRELIDWYTEREGWVLGFTATPFRSDGRGLGEFYDDMVVVASMNELIGEGYLVEPRVFTVPDEALPDLSGVKIRGGDYVETDLARAVDRQHLVGNIVEHWKRHAEGIRTICFGVSVRHSMHIAERFREVGIAAEHLDGTTPTAERDAILRRLAEGRTTVVSNVGCLCEGLDLPAVKCAVLARPTKSTGLYLQQAGRILRPFEGQRAILLDHAGCVKEHGLPQDDREFTLEGRERGQGRPKEAAERARTCPECFAVFSPLHRVCPECGYQFEQQAELPEESHHALIEVTDSPRKTPSQERMQADWERLQIEAAERGYKPGWAFFRFKAKYGVVPPANVPLARDPFSRQPAQRRPRTDEEKRTYFTELVRSEPDLAWARTRYRAEVGEMPPEVA